MFIDYSPMIADLTYLKTMANGDKKFIGEMIEIFKTQVAEFTSEMPALLKEGNYDPLARIAHKAKSSVAVMGMAKEKEMLEDIESEARNEQNHETLKTLIDTVIANSEKALEELDEQLNNT